MLALFCQCLYRSTTHENKTIWQTKRMLNVAQPFPSPSLYASFGARFNCRKTRILLQKAMWYRWQLLVYLFGYARAHFFSFHCNLFLWHFMCGILHIPETNNKEWKGRSKIWKLTMTMLMKMVYGRLLVCLCVSVRMHILCMEMCSGRLG